jgi:hypothetical protein
VSRNEPALAGVVLGGETVPRKRTGELASSFHPARRPVR